MEAATQDMAAIIADEIAEHNKGKPSTCISTEVQKARFDGLVQLVKTILTALEQAEMGKVVSYPRPNENLKVWFAFIAKPSADFRLVVQVDTKGLHFSWDALRWIESSNVNVTPKLFWDPLHRRWVGEELGRDHSRAGAPRVRESAEAVVTSAILTAYEVVARKES